MKVFLILRGSQSECAVYTFGLTNSILVYLNFFSYSVFTFNICQLFMLCECNVEGAVTVVLYLHVGVSSDTVFET